MQLTELSYKRKDWELQKLQLKEVNLIVGRNAVGKSRTIAMIGQLYQILNQSAEIGRGVSWKIGLESDDKRRIEMHISSYQRNNDIKNERIWVDGELILERKNKNTARVKSSLSNKWIELNPPVDKLVLHTRRDVKEFPFFEAIINWAENSYGFRFGNFDPYFSQEKTLFSRLNSLEETPFLLDGLNGHQQLIIKEMNALNYEIDSLDLIKRKGIPTIMIGERSLSKSIPHYNLSQGMFRTLSMLIYLEYLLKKNQPATILIDDFCEGLDYERTIKLGKIVFEKCKNSNVQLIVTSNDNFLMDVVDIKHWNILQRTGQVVTTISQAKYPELFRKFRFTGLSNFDFFASDFIAQKL